ncbi:MAG: hypothetical protein H6839_00880 [Planctomycetes bacterium]|nr:hypothetical protein [Planctomycetota bacterium]
MAIELKHEDSPQRIPDSVRSVGAAVSVLTACIVALFGTWAGLAMHLFPSAISPWDYTCVFVGTATIVAAEGLFVFRKIISWRAGSQMGSSATELVPARRSAAVVASLQVGGAAIIIGQGIARGSSSFDLLLHTLVLVALVVSTNLAQAKRKTP